jgi:hypothetical protein
MARTSSPSFSRFCRQRVSLDVSQQYGSTRSVLGIYLLLLFRVFWILMPRTSRAASLYGSSQSSKSSSHLLLLLKSKLLYDWRWVSFGFGHSFEAHDKILLFPFFCRKIALLFILGRPLWQEDETVICSAICQWPESRRMHNHTLLFHLRLLASLSVTSYNSQGLRWKYSYPLPRGDAVAGFLGGLKMEAVCFSLWITIIPSCWCVVTTRINILNLGICILLRVLDQVQGFPPNASLFQ